MRVQYLHLYQFRGFENLQVEFPAEAKTIAFIGENGCGKTSLLEGLGMLLQDSLHAHHDFGLVDWNNALNINKLYREGQISIGLQFTEEVYLYLAFLALNKRIIDTEKDELVRELVPGYKPGWKYAFETQLNDYLDVRSLIVLQYTAKSAVIDHYKNSAPIAFNIPMTTDFDLVSDWFIEYENDENRKRLRVDPNYRGAELEIIRKVITEGLSLLNGGQEGRFTELQTEIEETVKEGQVNSYLSIKKDGLLLNVDQLSDGEKRVLVLLIDIARRMIVAAKKNNEPQPLHCAGIILIDEPEQHLHPKWQRSLLPTLNHLFPNIQFVVATHSPLVVSNLFHYDEASDIVSINKQAAVYQLSSQAATLIQTTGRDVSNVLGDYFGVERRASLFQQKIDQLFAAFEEEIIDVQALKKQLDELKKLLGTSDPEVKSAEIIIDGLALAE